MDAALNCTTLVPERISNHQESDIDIICAAQYLIARRFDHFTVGYDNGAAIESFLLLGQIFVSFSLINVVCFGCYQFFLVHQQDACVGFEVHPVSSSDDL